MGYRMRKLLSIAIIVTALLSGCSSDGEAEANYSEEIKKVKQVMEQNVQFLQEENIEGYLSTIVESAREDSAEAMEAFFKNYDIEYELMKFDVVEEKSDKIVVETEQYADATYVAEGQSYKSHIAVAVHTFVKENGSWRISESV